MAEFWRPRKPRPRPRGFSRDVGTEAEHERARDVRGRSDMAASKRREWETKPIVQMVVDGVAYPGRAAGQTNADRAAQIRRGGEEAIEQLAAKGITNRRQLADLRNRENDEAMERYWASQPPVESCFECMHPKAQCQCAKP